MQRNHQKTAKFIAFLGVMGVGKSTLAFALAKRLGAQAFIEPEMSAWPVPVGSRWEDHVMRLEQWVRDTNLSCMQQARSAAINGTTSIADGAAFVFAKAYMDDPSCQFYYGLFSNDEMQQLRSIADIDWREAPCPDILVLIEADIEAWKRFLEKRGRPMDANQDFIANYHGQQQVIRSAAEQYAAEKKIKLIRFVNDLSSVDDNADRLATAITNLHV